MVFFNVELMEMPDDRAEAIIADPTFGHYSWWLKEARKSKPFTLSEKEEQVINLKDSNGKDALTQLYEEYTGDFEFPIEVNGEMKKLTGEEVAALFVSADRETRRKAYDAFYTVYKDNVKVITSILNFLVRDHASEGGLRGYPTAMTPAYLRDQVSQETIDNLMKVVEENYKLAQRYYRIKAKLLGLDVLRGWDRSAPIGKEYKLNWQEAHDLVVKSYDEFDPEVGQRAEWFFSRNWIDAEVRKGKRGGAFCSGTMPHLNPVVLMSFTDTLNDTYTLAHELGHGLHDLYAAEKQGMVTYHPPLCVAETASVFGEMLMTDKLLKDASDKEMKRDVICRELEGVFNTCSRQIMYIAFEKRLHEEGSKKRLSADDLCRIWQEEEVKIYGDSVVPHELQQYYWARIGHFFFARFYCFAYAFGKLFVLALYQLYLRDPKAFIPAYKDLLRAGGQEPPHVLAAKLGMDITKPEFWQGGFDYVEHRLSELERLIG
jgi:oligoendopeptidase F